MADEPTQTQISLRLPVADLEALDRELAKRYLATGDKIDRSEHIRRLIRVDLGQDPTQ